MHIITLSYLNIVIPSRDIFIAQLEPTSRIPGGARVLHS